MENGTLYYSEKLQLWIYQYYFNNNRKTLKQRKKETVKDFKARVTKIKNELNNNTYIQRDNKTFRDILEEHVNSKYNTNTVSSNTYRRDRQTIQQIEKTCKLIIDMPIQKITTSHILQVFPNITEYSNNTIVKIYRLINKVFKIAISDRLIQFNPMESEKIMRPKSKKEDEEIKALTVEEQKKFVGILESEEHKYKYILLLQLYTGMRIGEVLALSTKDIDYKKGTITINKTLSRNEEDKIILGNTTKTENSKRIIYISERVKNVLNKIQENQVININGFLFYDNIKDSFVTPSEVNSYLRRLNEKHNITSRLHTHVLRHTFATRNIEAGVSAKVLQQILGHKNINTTLDTYTSVFSEFNRDENEKYNRYLEEKCL